MVGVRPGLSKVGGGPGLAKPAGLRSVRRGRWRNGRLDEDRLDKGGSSRGRLVGTTGEDERAMAAADGVTNVEARSGSQENRMCAAAACALSSDQRPARSKRTTSSATRVALAGF